MPGGCHIDTSGLTACTPGLAPGPTLGNEYGPYSLPSVGPGVDSDMKLLTVRFYIIWE